MQIAKKQALVLNFLRLVKQKNLGNFRLVGADINELCSQAKMNFSLIYVLITKTMSY